MRAACIAALLVLTLVPIRVRAQQPTPISWDHYHTYQEIDAYLHQMVARHPDLATLLVIGKSRASRPIYALEINNPKTGPAAEKPGFYMDGNIHGGEVLGGEGALFLVQRLLEGYASDAEIKRLVDRSALYLVPIVNPDGRVISVSTPENHRWNARPVDEDHDGRLDEDPPEDLDGDGNILRMRIRDPKGAWVISDQDPRLMVRRRGSGGAGPRFRMLSEGIDNDGDGRFNEDSSGGIDLNRNFPANWSSTQFASGPFPLSEPETWALVKYITDRPNIAAIHTFHTSGGMILRFPTLADQDWEFPAEDVADYTAIGRAGSQITGYHNYAADKKTIVDLMHPGHGVFNDWASKVFGTLAITTEMWRHPFGGLPALRWNDQVLGGRGFVAWHAFQHPQLGRVELGGWTRWSQSSPPPALIQGELERNARWVLTFAQRLPRLELRGFKASLVADSQDTFDVAVSVANAGWMSTATAQARRILHSARPIRVSLKLENASLIQGRASLSLGQLAGRRADRPDAVRSLSWRIQLQDRSQPATVRLEVVSEKAGTRRRVLHLKGPE